MEESSTGNGSFPRGRILYIAKHRKGVFDSLRSLGFDVVDYTSLLERLLSPEGEAGMPKMGPEYFSAIVSDGEVAVSEERILRYLNRWKEKGFRPPKRYFIVGKDIHPTKEYGGCVETVEDFGQLYERLRSQVSVKTMARKTKGRVLLAGWGDRVLEPLKSSLEEEGYSAERADAISDVERKASEGESDALIISRLPHEAAKAIELARGTSPDMSKIIVTTWPEWNDLDICREAGCQYMVFGQEFNSERDTKRLVPSIEDSVSRKKGAVFYEKRGKKAIVVDDQDYMRNFVEGVLKDVGLEQVCKTPYARRASEILSREGADIVVADFRTRRIGKFLESAKERGVPAVLMSDYGRYKPDNDLFWKFDSFLQKPFDAQALAFEVVGLLDHDAYSEMPEIRAREAGELGCNIYLLGLPGAGKTSISRRLRRGIKSLKPHVRYTTRGQRSNEKPGEEYHYVDEPTFRELAKAGVIKDYYRYAGNLYSIDRPHPAGFDSISIVAKDGFEKMASDDPRKASVFIGTSLETLEKRLEKRSRRERERRMREAEEYMAGFAEHFPGGRSPLKFDLIVTNDSLKDPCEETLEDVFRHLKRSSVEIAWHIKYLREKQAIRPSQGGTAWALTSA